MGDSPGFTAESNVIVPGQPLDQNVPVHFAAVFDDNNDIMQLFINGMLVGETATTRNLTDISFINAWLGRSLYDPDDYLNGSYDELRIYGEALSVGQILGNFKVGPDSLNSSVIPEPATAFLGLAGLAMLGMRRRRSH